MSKEMAAAFFTLVNQREDLGQRVAALPTDDQRAWAVAVAGIAQAEGYTFHPDLIDAAIARYDELNETELERVNGGADSGYQGSAVVTYKLTNAWPKKVMVALGDEVRSE